MRRVILTSPLPSWWKGFVSENAKRGKQSKQYLTKPSNLNCSPHLQSSRMRTSSLLVMSGRTFPHIAISCVSIVPEDFTLTALEPSK